MADIQCFIIMTLFISMISALLLAGSGVSGNTADLAHIIECANPGFDPKRLVFYGCYCGPGGQGTPVDAIDKCCQDHDNCYMSFEKVPGCRWVWPVLSAVSYSCDGSDVTCYDENLCRKTQCECDSKLAKCLQNKAIPNGRARCKDYFRSEKFDLSWLLH